MFTLRASALRCVIVSNEGLSFFSEGKFHTLDSALGLSNCVADISAVPIDDEKEKGLIWEKSSGEKDGRAGAQRRGDANLVVFPVECGEL
jgi:hypothetical protein